jgi:hypothetical protein
MVIDMPSTSFVNSVSAEIQNIRDIGASGNANKPWALAAEQMRVLSRYYAETLDQAEQSYYLALFTALIGLGVFVAAAFYIFLSKGEYATITIISGAVVEVISGVGFYLHSKTLPAMMDNSNRMDRMHRYLLSYALCENLPDPQKQTALAELMRSIASAT